MTSGILLMTQGAYSRTGEQLERDWCDLDPTANNVWFRFGGLGHRDLIAAIQLVQRWRMWEDRIRVFVVAGDRNGLVLTGLLMGQDKASYMCSCWRVHKWQEGGKYAELVSRGYVLAWWVQLFVGGLGRLACMRRLWALGFFGGLDFVV